MNKGESEEVERECEDHSVENLCNGIKKKEGSSQRRRRCGKAAMGKMVPRPECR